MGEQKIKVELLIHDLKGPLAVIETGIVSLLQREEKYGSLNEKQQKVLQRVLRNTKLTKTLVNDALEVGRSAEGVSTVNSFTISDFIKLTLLEVFDLNDQETSDVIRGCSDLAALKKILREAGINLLVAQELWDREVCLDERKLRQILRNLLHNAFKYKSQYVEIDTEIKDKHLLVSVRDDGNGIPETYHKKIFECYFQMDSDREYCVRGHGLGLAGVMVLAEDMGGELSLQSDEGEGAKFSVRVPIKDFSFNEALKNP